MPRPRPRLDPCDCWDCEPRDPGAGAAFPDPALAAARQDPPPKCLVVVADGVLAGIDGYYSSGQPHRQWIATQLVRRLADPVPTDSADDDERWSTPDATAEWDDIRTRCLSLAVATLEEAG